MLNEIIHVSNAITNFIPVGIVVIEKENGKIVYVNERAKELYGVDPYGLEMANHSTKLMKLLTLSGEIYPSEQLPASKALFTGKKATDRLIIERPDGSQVIVDATASPIEGENGEIIAALEVFEDKTEQIKAQKAIRMREEQFRALMTANSDVVYRMSADWREMQRLHGRKFLADTYLPNRTWQEKYIPPEVQSQIMESIQHAIDNKTTFEIEHQVFRPDGSVGWTYSRAIPILNQDGEIVEWLGIAKDITERKKVDATLQSQSQIINSAQDAIISTDKSFIIRSWNPSAQRLFGWSAEEAVGKSTEILQVEYPTLKGTTREQAHKQLMSNGFWKEEVIYRRKDGSSFAASATVSLVRNKKGKITGTAAIVHDITPRKKREKRLREALRDLDHAQAVGKIGSWRLDTNSNVLSWSDQNHQIFGIPKGTPLTYETFLDTVHPEDREYVDQKWKAALNGEPYNIEHRILVDGNVRWVWEKAELEFDEKGNVKGGFGTTQEITEFVKMQQKVRDNTKRLQKYSKELELTQAKLERKAAEVEEYASHMEELAEERAAKLKDAERLAAIGATAGMIGHDIRNPLQSIDGSLFLTKQAVISSSASNEQKRELFEELDLIREQVAYINHIIADLQDFAKKAQPKTKNQDVRKSINESILMTNVPDNIQVNIVLPEESLTFSFDPDYMKRIFVNLINNAVQAMPDGGELTILVFRKDGEVLIRFEDTGVGIAEDAKPNIFKPLFTTKSKGQGFGLAVCKKLMDAQGGEISFESQEGKGTTFTIKIPIKRN